MNVIRLQGDPFYRAIRVAIHGAPIPLCSEDRTYLCYTHAEVWFF